MKPIKAHLDIKVMDRNHHLLSPWYRWHRGSQGSLSVSPVSLLFDSYCQHDRKILSCRYGVHLAIGIVICLVENLLKSLFCPPGRSLHCHHRHWKLTSSSFLDAIASSSSYPCGEWWWWVIISDLPSISALSAMSAMSVLVALVAVVTLGVQQFVILLFSINIWWPIWRLIRRAGSPGKSGSLLAVLACSSSTSCCLQFSCINTWWHWSCSFSSSSNSAVQLFAIQLFGINT